MKRAFNFLELHFEASDTEKFVPHALDYHI